MRPLGPYRGLPAGTLPETSACGDGETVVNAAKLAEYGRRLSGRREPLGRDSSLDSGWLPGMDSNSSSRHESAGNAIQPAISRRKRNASSSSRSRRGSLMFVTQVVDPKNIVVVAARQVGKRR